MKPIKLQRPNIDAITKQPPRANKQSSRSRLSFSSYGSLLTVQPEQTRPAWVMKMVQHARCERPNKVFQILYLRTAGDALSMYSYRVDLWYLITWTTLLIYMTLVHTEVMNSIQRIVLNTQLMFAKPPGIMISLSGIYSQGRGFRLGYGTMQRLSFSTPNKMKPSTMV